MYSGSTITTMSGRVIGVHQKIDRIARTYLTKTLPDDTIFPTATKILHFEGKNGPDGIKRKSPAKDEPWHYYSPFNDDDSHLAELIRSHYDLLVTELRVHNNERIAFEAAWLAHALVDGLTPAHHYPYEEKLSVLRGGEGIETRDSIKAKLLMPGDTKRQQVANNWKMWGPKGLMSTHGLFEMGIAVLIAPISFSDSIPTSKMINDMHSIGVEEWFKRSAREIAVLDMYERYYKRGWTTKLTLEVRHKLLPIIIQTVALTWYSALVDANLVELPK